MKVREYRDYFCSKIPKELSASWDNDGLLCCPDPDREVKRLLVVLDITESAVQEAIDGGYDLILSHHPLIFKGVKALSGEDGTSRKLLALVKAGISAMCYHTRLDAVTGGVNDVLSEVLGLTEVAPLGEGENALGRIGRLESPLSPEALAVLVKERLSAPAVLLGSAGKPVSRLALVGGAGRDEVGLAAAMGADAFLTGELSYHQLVDAPENGMTLLAAGHFYTEAPVTNRLADLARALDPKVEAVISARTEIKCI